DERVGIPGFLAEHHIRRRVEGKDDREGRNERPGAAEAGDGVGDALARSLLFLDDHVRIAGGAYSDQLVSSMELSSKHRQHVHPGERLSLEQDLYVMPIDLDADGLLQREGAGLVRRLFQHRREAEEIPVHRLVDQDFLLVFVDRGHANRTGHHHVGPLGRIADLVDALARSERLHFDRGGETRRLVVVEQTEQRDLTQNVWRTRHWNPPSFHYPAAKP